MNTLTCALSFDYAPSPSANIEMSALSALPTKAGQQVVLASSLAHYMDTVCMRLFGSIQKNQNNQVNILHQSVHRASVGSI